jgi:carbonic anhydrase/acetyltransferase-like protein (isoleucine patch superfamily)
VLIGGLLVGSATLAWWLLAPVLVVAPLLYGVTFVVVAGLLSLPHQHAVRPGRFPRNLTDPTYRARRLYGLCWTAVYYATPLYFLALSLPWFKRLTFRLFGYRGQMDFTVYPDTWIRDLPLLEFGKGAYVSNKATLGTNVAQSNGSLLVDRVSVGPGALVGHLAMVSTGTVLEEGAEVGVGCAVGSKVRFRKDSFIGACCAVGHLVELGEGCNVGYMSSIGIAARIGPGVRLQQVSIVPNRARVDDQAAADALLSSAQSPLPRLAERLAATPPQEPSPDAPVAVEEPKTPDKGCAGWNRFE